MPRLLELTLVIAALPLWGPLVLLTALLLLITEGRPVFFRQVRPGFRAKPFTLIKFRTMRPGSEPDAERMTRIGRFLRVTSLDELPELFNVLRGEMALVGPRPLLMAYLDEYTPEEMHRHDVRPGITGLAQINGRTGIPRDEKIRWDLKYIRERSLRLDLSILFRTVFHLKGA